MNDDEVRERARQRRFAAELAEVLEAPLGRVADERRTAWAGRWLAAAIVLLGVGVTLGVAWLRREAAAAPVQQPEGLDVVAPWYETEWPLTWSWFTHCADAAAVAQREPAVHAVSVKLHSAEELQRLTSMGGLQGLHLQFQEWGSPDRAGWRSLAGMPDLEVLHVELFRTPLQDGIDELRAAPHLRILGLYAGATTLDADLGAAIAKSTHLTALMLGRMRLSAEGLHELARLPQLQMLWFDAIEKDPAVLDALPELVQLRVLALSFVAQGRVVGPDSLRALSLLPNLETLFLFGPTTDEHLRELPGRLSSLHLHPGNWTADGIRTLRRLARLREFDLIDGVRSELVPAVAEVLRSLPLESFRLREAIDDERIWSALQDAPQLRRLRVSVRGGFADVAPRCASLRGLERLELVAVDDPDLTPLDGLRELPRLRRLDLGLGRAGTNPTERAAKIGKLQKALGPRVAVHCQ